MFENRQHPILQKRQRDSSEKEEAMAEVLRFSDRKDESGYLGEINPSFSFPMTSPAIAIGQQRSANIPIPFKRPADITIHPVPAFTFPSPSTPPLQDTASSSPSRSRAAGHRRGPSEFIGGDGSKAGPGLMSTSPVKGENVLPNPGTSGRRRGHAHRRSAAISHHDISNIINNPDPSSRRTGSAPATPSDLDFEFGRPTIDRARSQPSLPNNVIPDLSDRPELPLESPSPSSTARPRVGFSDKLEYIPRPLSMVSSATSSSISTIIPSHSLNNSITSLKSLGTSSPPSTRKDFQTGDIFGSSLNGDADESLSRSYESRFGRGSSKLRHNSPPPPSAQDLLLVPEEDDDTSAQQVPQLRTDLSRLRGVLDDRPYSSPEPTESKRSKRGKSWSGLLSRRSKTELVSLGEGNGGNFMREEEQPEFSLDNVDFDQDSTYVVRHPEYDVARPVNSNHSPLTPMFDTDTDSAGVLDLDEVWHKAGLNNTNASDTARARQLKKAMYSNGGAAFGGFAEQGMQVHRRAESAPVMPPIDYSLGFPRYGSNPQMADVFEEDEDDYNQTSLSRQASRQNKSLSGKKVDALGVNIEETQGQLMTSTFLPLESNGTAQALDRISRYGKDPSQKTRSSPLVVTAEALPPTLFQPDTLHNYASSHNSFPSQSDRISNFYGSTEASPLQTSFDAPRLGTAHSTGTDRSAWSAARIGESHHPTTTSIDDVPSLVSSSSTMISHIPHTPIVGSRLPGERSQSLSVEATTRPRTPLQAAKRASLASLSKLMGGSFSEKSKLSIESKADGEEEGGDTNKVKKRNRLSRLMKMKFWKSKDDVRGLAQQDSQNSE